MTQDMPAFASVCEEDAARFAKTCARVISHEHLSDGIGTLSEKTMHAVTKAYLMRDGDRAEVKVGRYVADVLCADGRIFEVQTQGFSRLKPKLDAFLPDHPVTVVYPFPMVKYTVTVSRETGEMTKKRRSTRPGKIPYIFKELYRIRPELGRPGLTVRVLLLAVTEYRVTGKQQGDSAAAKRQRQETTRFERMPSALVGAFDLAAPQDYAALLPDTLPEVFDSKALAAAERVRLPYAQTMLNVLFHMGAVERVGKKGNALLYRRAEV